MLDPLGAGRTKVKPAQASLVLRHPVACSVESRLRDSIGESRAGHSFEGCVGVSQQMRTVGHKTY